MPESASAWPSAGAGAGGRGQELGAEVAVQVAGVIEARAELGAGRRPVVREERERARAVEDPHRARGRAVVVVAGGAHGHLGAAVAVQVAGRGHGGAEAVAGRVAAPVQETGAVEPREHARVARLARDRLRRADGDVAEAVAVDVAGVRHGAPEGVAGVEAVPGEEQRAARAAVDEGLAGGRRDGAVHVGRADGELGRAVAVEVGQARERPAEELVLRAFERVERGERGARDDAHAARAGALAVVVDRAHGQIRDEVQVDVADPGHGPAEVVVARHRRSAWRAARRSRRCTHELGRRLPRRPAARPRTARWRRRRRGRPVPRPPSRTSCCRCSRRRCAAPDRWRPRRPRRSRRWLSSRR